MTNAVSNEWPPAFSERLYSGQWPHGTRRIGIEGWPRAENPRWRGSWPADYVDSNGRLNLPQRLEMTIGTPGTFNFGAGSSKTTGRLLDAIVHRLSGSVVADTFTQQFTYPTITTTVDPFADATASGFTFDGDPFPVTEDGYSIGTAGALHFAIAFDLDAEEAIIDPIHTASLSVM